MTTRNSLKVLLGSGNFRLLLGMNLTAEISAGMRLGALSWLLYDITGMSLSVGLSVAVRAFPSILLGPFGGIVADLVDRRWLVAMDRFILVILMIITGFLVFNGQLEQWHLLALSASAGALFAFSQPASFAMLGEAAPRRLMAQAGSLRSLALQIGEMSGPFAAGLAIGLLGAGLAFWIIAAGFAIAAILVLRLPKSLGQAAIHDVHSIWRQLSQGFTFVLRTKPLAWVAVIALLNNFTGVAVFPILPAFSEKVLNMGPIGYAIMSGTIGSGLITGSLIISLFGMHKHRGTILVLSGLVWDLLMALLGFQRSLLIILPMLFSMGVAGSVWGAASITLFQEKAPSKIRGRVLSVLLAAMQFFPIGWLLGGALADWLGIRTALVISAATSTPLAALIWVLVPSFRKS